MSVHDVIKSRANEIGGSQWGSNLPGWRRAEAIHGQTHSSLRVA